MCSFFERNPIRRRFSVKTLSAYHFNQTFSAQKLRIVPIVPSTCWQPGNLRVVAGVLSEAAKVEESRHPEKCGIETSFQKQRPS